MLDIQLSLLIICSCYLDHKCPKASVHKVSPCVVSPLSRTPELPEKQLVCSSSSGTCCAVTCILERALNRRMLMGTFCKVSNLRILPKSCLDVFCFLIIIGLTLALRLFPKHCNKNTLPENFLH